MVEAKVESSRGLGRAGLPSRRDFLRQTAQVAGGLALASCALPRMATAHDEPEAPRPREQDPRSQQPDPQAAEPVRLEDHLIANWRTQALTYTKDNLLTIVFGTISGIYGLRFAWRWLMKRNLDRIAYSRTKFERSEDPLRPNKVVMRVRPLEETTVHDVIKDDVGARKLIWNARFTDRTSSFLELPKTDEDRKKYGGWWFLNASLRCFTDDYAEGEILYGAGQPVVRERFVLGLTREPSDGVETEILRAQLNTFEEIEWILAELQEHVFPKSVMSLEDFLKSGSTAHQVMHNFRKALKEPRRLSPKRWLGDPHADLRNALRDWVDERIDFEVAHQAGRLLTVLEMAVGWEFTRRKLAEYRAKNEHYYVDSLMWVQVYLPPTDVDSDNPNIVVKPSLTVPEVGRRGSTLALNPLDAHVVMA